MRDLHDLKFASNTRQLFRLYLEGALELMALGAHGLKRELIIDLEMNGLTPEKDEIIRYRAADRWDKNNEFSECAKPSRPLSPEAERILGVTNEQLDRCHLSAILLEDFIDYMNFQNFAGQDGNCLKL